MHQVLGACSWNLLITYTENDARKAKHDACQATESGLIQLDDITVGHAREASPSGGMQLRRPQCCVCYDDKVTTGTWCADARHLTCDDCFARHLSEQTRRDATGAYVHAERLREGDALLLCPLSGLAVHDPNHCTAAFADGEIARHANETSLQRYMDSKAWVIEERVRQVAVRPS